MKHKTGKLVSLLCAVSVAAAGAAYAMPAAALEGFDPGLGVLGIHQTGSCGEQVTWSLDEETGTLTISGTGDMAMSNRELMLGFLPIAGSVQSIVIGEGVTGICANAFLGFDRLTSVTLPESLKRIGQGAFDGCRSLEELDIPAGVEDIGAYAFLETPWLKHQKETQSMVIVGGVLLCCGNECPGERLTAEEVYALTGNQFYFEDMYALTIPDGVKTIADRAFAGCYEMITLTVPEGVEKIGAEAFYCCTYLVQADLPDTLKEIGSLAFGGTDLRPGFELPAGVEKIGGGAFNTAPFFLQIAETEPFAILNGYLLKAGTEQSGVVTIPDGVKEIGTLAFCECTGITSVVIPDSVKVIGESAFAGCTNLTTVQFADGLEHIGNYAFNGCPLLSEIDLPDTVKTIGDGAFFECSALQSLDLSAALEDIGFNAFACCPALTEVNFPDSLKNIGESAFARDGLLSVVLPDGLESLGVYAFSENGQLVSVTIPDTLAGIGTGVFDGTPWQTALASTDPFVIFNDILMRGGTAASGEITLPDGIREIADDAFRECADLLRVQIPDSVTKIGDFAFEHSGLTELVIPPNVTEIGLGAFSFCEDLTTVTLPDDLRSIGTEAFYGCVNLNTIIVPDTVTEIADNAFDACANLTLCGGAGSYAESYAKAHKLPFRVIGAAQMTGDVDCSGSVDVSDAVLYARYLVADGEAEISEQGIANADCDKNGQRDGTDLSMILQFIAKQITF